MQHQKSCGLVVYRPADHTFLLLQHAKANHWDNPKGKIESNERETQTALRELEEETGITAAVILPGFREHIRYFFYHNKEKIVKDVYFFLATTDEEVVTLSKEHKNFMWLPFEQAVRQVTYDNAKNILKKANEFLQSH
ncbi:MAG: NUDIX domain-containing protein [Nanoarchaeota archaeon]|nr:NUDIX domain-containing protein [Nanoarchaeota archaeon]